MKMKNKAIIKTIEKTVLLIFLVASVLMLGAVLYREHTGYDFGTKRETVFFINWQNGKITIEREDGEQRVFRAEQNDSNFNHTVKRQISYGEPVYIEHRFGKVECVILQENFWKYDLTMAQGEVIDMNKDHIEVRLSDGSKKTYGYQEKAFDGSIRLPKKGDTILFNHDINDQIISANIVFD